MHKRAFKENNDKVWRGCDKHTNNRIKQAKNVFGRDRFGQASNSEG
jgi:hypothetical protein